jgi:hypothetical protein
MNFAFLLIPFASLFAILSPGHPHDEESLTYTPWFTGPLLAPTPINMDPKHPAIEPSLTVFDTFGVYNSKWQFEKRDPIWSINPLIDFQFGLTQDLGMEVLASTISNFQRGKTATHFQDTILRLGYQLSNDIKGSWVPDARIILQEIFPTGKYQNLSPSRPAIDATGFGSFQTGPIVIVRKLFHLHPYHLSLSASAGYSFPASVSVRSFNTYGGGHGTKGKVSPGQSLIAFFSGELSLNQRWVFAFDSELFYQRTSTFSGRTIDPTGLPPSIQISFAPEIEYNFNEASGLLGGLWFTLAGKNAEAFGSAFLAYVYIF